MNSAIEKIEMFDEIDSTNLYALRTIKEDINRLIVANNQTNGQGRFGKKYYSYHNCGLYFTLDINKNRIDEKKVMMKKKKYVILERFNNFNCKLENLQIS